MSIRTREVVALLLCLLPAASANGNEWTGAGGDNLWTNVENWSQGVVPMGATAHPNFGWDDPQGPFYPLTPDPADDGPRWNNDVKLQHDDTITLIDDSVTMAAAYGVRVGNGGATNTLQITGGHLEIGGVPPVGGDRLGWHLQVGRGYPGFDGGPVNANPTATVLMSGGTINTNGLLIPEQFVNYDLPDPTDSAPLNGELIMSGGVINARWMNLGQLKGNGRAELSGDAQINLWPNVASQRNNGGMLIFNRNWFLDGRPVPSSGQVRFDIREDATVNIFGHLSDVSMTPDESEVERYQRYVDDGMLTANDGTAEPIITLHECPADGTFDEFCLSGVMITLSAPVVEPSCSLNSQGDLDGNGSVGFADFLILSANFGKDVNSHAEGDIDCSGQVEFADFLVLSTNFGAEVGTALVPEPSGWTLLAVVGLAGALPRQGRRKIR